MGDWGPAIAAVPLLALSLGLLAHHVSSWRRLKCRKDLPPDDRRFFRRQLARRVQASALMGVLAVGLVVGANLISHRLTPRLFIFFWCGMLFLGIWMGLLAALDFRSVARYGKRKRHELANERFSRSPAEVARVGPHEGNGHKRPVQQSDA
jgi:hypothetical protein